MKTRITLRIFAWVLFFSAPVFAVLPPDAGSRPQQIRSEYALRAKKYNQRQDERQAEAVRAYQRAQADLLTPPWMRGQAQSAMTPGGASVPGTEKAAKRNHRFLISVVLLILLGGVAGWIRHATREVDE